MHFLSLILAYFFLSSTALADTAISLPPMKGNKALDMVATKNITGSCGTSIVRVMGVTDATDNSYGIDLDAGKLIIRSGPTRELSISSENNVLSDQNGLACVSTKQGNRLLIWSKCGGSSCGENFSFFIIDPDRLIFLAPTNPRKGLCDEKCASQLLDGNRLPYKINSQ